MPKKKIRRRKKLSQLRIKSVPRGTFKLPIQTVTFVPSTTKKSKKISGAALRKRVNETRRFLSKLFGGYTSIKAVGGYIAKDGKLIREKAIKVTAYSERVGFMKKKAKWFKYIRMKKKQWGQESMGIIIENDMFYL